MSVLHRVEDGGRVFEVRAAGRTRRLYVDGVLHTCHNPSRALTGSVWDPLALSALFAPPGTVHDCLVLGVGGGAAVHLLRRHVAPLRIVGVEYDGRVLGMARDWFDLAGDDLELVEGDAVRYVERNSARRFDLVVDDLFDEVDGEPVRHAAADGGAWWRRLAGLLRPGGVLVVNFTWRRDLISSDLCQDVAFRATFPSAFRFTFRSYENAVAAFATSPVTAANFERRIAAHPELGRAAVRRQAKHRLSTLWQALS